MSRIIALPITIPFGAARRRGAGLALLLLLLLLSIAAGPAWSQASAAAPPGGALDPVQARHLLDLLGNEVTRRELIDQLRLLAASPPVPPAALAAQATRAPAQPPPAAAKATLVPGSLGEQLVGESTTWANMLSAEAAATARALTGFPAMMRWLRRAATDPELRATIFDALGKTAVILLVSMLAALAARRLLRGVMRALERGAAGDSPGPEPDETVLSETHPRVRAARSARLLQRLPHALLRAALGFLPAVVFAAVGNMLLGAGFVLLFSTKMAVTQTLNAVVYYWATVCVVRLVLTDPVARFRLFDLGDRVASFLDPWLRWLAAIAIFGTVLALVGRRLGLAPPAQEGIGKLVALAVHIGLVGLVWRVRRPVARKLQPRPGASAFWTEYLTGVSRYWHWLASVLIMAEWLVWAAQPEGGLERVVRVFGLTILVLIGLRVCSILTLGALDRSFGLNGAPGVLASPGFATRVQRYHPVLRQVALTVLAAAALFLLLLVWGVNALDWFRGGALGARLLAALGTVLVITLISLVAWEAANAAIERQLHHLSAAGLAAQAARLRTLAPLLRTCLLSTILVFVVLTALSEIGINTGPLLAGAGIFGVALGFGSQKLVQDFITGILLLLENAMQVGDWVTVSGLSGTVENLSVRTIRLRAADGSVHVIPFSSVTTVTNTNRGIGNAAVSVTVAGSEDVDAVGAALKQIAAEMRLEPAYRSGIRADLALWGVDRVDASTVTLVGQIECTDAARWGVQREFNRRVKLRFQELGIRLANPATAVLLDEATTPRPAHAAAPTGAAASAAPGPR